MLDYIHRSDSGWLCTFVYLLFANELLMNKWENDGVNTLCSFFQLSMLEWRQLSRIWESFTRRLLVLRSIFKFRNIVAVNKCIKINMNLFGQLSNCLLRSLTTYEQSLYRQSYQLCMPGCVCLCVCVRVFRSKTLPVILHVWQMSDGHHSLVCCTC